jgi:hypothetical protein
MEIWKDYDSNYRVSNFGKVWSKRNNIELKQFEDNYGYLMVTIYSKTLKVHRLVAVLFLECNYKDTMTVNHKNGIKSENNVNNLEWMTSVDNIKHAFETGLMTKSEDVHTAILTIADVEQIKQLFVEYKLGDTEIGALFGANNSTISNIRRGLSWKDVLPELKFEKKSPVGRGVGKKLCGEDIPLIRKMSKDGIACADIARKFNVAFATIRGILLGATWKNY